MEIQGETRGPFYLQELYTLIDLLLILKCNIATVQLSKLTVHSTESFPHKANLTNATQVLG